MPLAAKKGARPPKGELVNKVRHEMTTKVVYAREKDDIQQAHQSMRALGVRHVPVTRDKRLVGILSDRDILLHAQIGADGSMKVPSKPIDEVMIKNVVTCRESDTIVHCIDTLLHHRISCLPVVASQGNLIGIVTTTDLLQLLRDRDWEPSNKIPFKWKAIALLDWIGARPLSA
jgi:CBS domain-containing protein